MKNKKWIIVPIAIVILLILAYGLYWLNDGAAAPESLGAVRVNVETYLAGKNQITHPAVVTFPEQWNGARYWLAYSPYPYADGEEENPCIATSDDLLYWECPPGLANPIADNEETGCDELKDPHLLYREDLDRLEMWYLGRLSQNLGGDGTSLLLMRKCSEDGIHWTDYEVMASTEYLSPTVYWDGSKYQMWSIGYALWDTEGTFVYQESTDGIHWTDPVKCSLGEKSDDIDIWHGAVTVHDGAYHFVFVDNTDRQEILYCSSTDGIHFGEPEVIVENGGYWDYLYRPTLVYTGEKVACMYGVVNQVNQWYISISTGEDEYHLIGINENQAGAMYPLADDVTDTHGVGYWIRQLYNSIRMYMRPEILALAVFETILLTVFHQLRRKKSIAVLCMAGNLLLSAAYLFALLKPVTAVSWLGGIIAWLCLNIGMSSVLMCMHLSSREDQ